MKPLSHTLSLLMNRWTIWHHPWCSAHLHCLLPRSGGWSRSIFGGLSNVFVMGTPKLLKLPLLFNSIEYYLYYQYFIQKPKVSPAFCFSKWPFGVTTCFHHFSIILKQTQTMMELMSIWSTMCIVFSWRNPWQYVCKGSLLLIEPGNEVLPRRRQWWDSNLFHNVILDINIISNCWLGLR